MEYLCQHGNCDETDTPYVVSSQKLGIKSRFCSLAHLVAWAMNEIEIKERNHGSPTVLSAQLAQEGIFRLGTIPEVKTCSGK